ncbi:MAG TPA: DUF3450 family protein [bacterium]|nr:DUF3450 family protein [bacterium]HOL48419.1 DUF3450 family protein [bacterium]HPQ19458.1 DUF3450 family protein [bacterium]
MKKILLAIFLFILFFNNLKTFEPANLFSDLKANDKKAEFDKIIIQLQAERENYYKLYNDWQKEKTKIKEEIDFIKKEIKLLETKIDEENKTNQILEKQIIALQNELKSDTQMIYTPLFYNVLNELEEIIKTGIPFKKEQRLDEILIRKKIVNDEHSTLITKFNSVWEIAFKELEFTSTNEVYDDKLNLNNQNEIVKYIRLGKIGLYFFDASKKKFGIYSNQKCQLFTDNFTKKNIILLSEMINNIKPINIIILPLPNFIEKK